MNGWIDSRERAPLPQDYPILAHFPLDTGWKLADGRHVRRIMCAQKADDHGGPSVTSSGGPVYCYWRSALITDPKELFTSATIVIDKDDEMFAVQHEREEIAKLVSGLFECGYNVPLERQGDREKHNDSLRRLKARLGLDK